jgi:hypothetical protein
MRALFVVAGLALGLGGCVSAAEPPAWLGERAEADESYPSLRDVPREHDANTDARHWRTLERDLVRAGRALKTHPRAQPATTAEDPAAFLEEARRELEETRQAHEPN